MVRSNDSRGDAHPLVKSLLGSPEQRKQFADKALNHVGPETDQGQNIRKMLTKESSDDSEQPPTMASSRRYSPQKGGHAHLQDPDAIETEASRRADAISSRALDRMMKEDTGRQWGSSVTPETMLLMFPQQYFFRKHDRAIVLADDVE